MQKSAQFSRCQKYRYSLRRIWRGEDLFAPATGSFATDCMFIGLNPSTADASNDDPTIRRCIDFAKRWGYGGLIMANLFAYRATIVSDMKKYPEPIGPDNDQFLLNLANGAGVVVAAWGNHGSHLGRSAHVVKLFEEVDCPLHCLKRNDDGSPVHPLYQPAYLTPQKWG